MNVLINYNALNTKVLFEILLKDLRFEVKILHPILHFCKREYRSLDEVGEHLHLTDEELKAFKRLFFDSEFHSSPIKPIELCCNAKRIQCHGCQ